MNIRGIVALVVVLAVLVPASPAFADLADPAGAWHVTELRLAEAHRTSRGAGVTVALLGDGVDAHRDVTAALLPPLRIGAPSTKERRSTHAAGIIASRGDGTKGLLGIAPQAMVLPVEVGADAKARDGAALARGIDAAVAAKAGVIVLPDPNTELTTDLLRAVRAAVAAGAVVVAPAGVGFPMLSTLGTLPGVVSVAATTRGGKLATSSLGPSLDLDLVAPGQDLVGPAKLSLGDEYIETGGTDLAPAVVGGVAALVRAKHPALTARDVVRRLTEAGARKHTLDRGWGTVDPVAALTADLPALPPAAGAAGDAHDAQWYLDAFRIPDAHRLTRGSAVTVGLIGNGVRAEHPDLTGRVDKPVWVDGKGMLQTGTPPSAVDLDALGNTGAASLVVARGGMLGVAPEARLIAVDALSTGNAQVGPALRWLVAKQAKVVLIPAGPLDPAGAEAVRDAVRRDVVVIRPFDDRNQPVAGLLTVGAVDGRGRPDRTGTGIDLSAPGTLLLVASSSPSGSPYTGTAVPALAAAGFVAGVTALLRAADPSLRAADAVNRLVQTATPGTGYGRGLVDPLAALTSTLPPVAQHPLGDPGPPQPVDGAGPTGIRWWWWLAAGGAVLAVLAVVLVAVVLLARR